MEAKEIEVIAMVIDYTEDKCYTFDIVIENEVCELAITHEILKRYCEENAILTGVTDELIMGEHSQTDWSINIEDWIIEANLSDCSEIVRWVLKTIL